MQTVDEMKRGGSDKGVLHWCVAQLCITPVYALCAVLCYKIESSAFCDPVQVAESLVNTETVLNERA